MSIAKKCEINDCNGAGHLDRNGIRRLQKGLCDAHYQRQRKGFDISIPSRRAKRPAIIQDDIAKIPLGVNAKDGHAIVDSEYSWLDKYQWYTLHGYAMTRINSKNVRMHHIIIGKPSDGMVVDHIDNDRLNNRSINLQIITSRENIIKSRRWSNNTSGYRGVTETPWGWRSEVVSFGVAHRLGTFKRKEDAAEAYNKKALELFGSFAVLNIIKGEE